MKSIPLFRPLTILGMIAFGVVLPDHGGAVHRMDAQIGRAPGVYIGDNLYGTLDGQTVSLSLEEREAFFFRMQHDLELTNSTLLGSAMVRIRGNYSRRLDLKVFRTDGARINVTAAITGQGLNLTNFDVDTEADFSVRATRRSEARRGLAKVKIAGVLTASGEVTSDVALAQIQVK